MKRILIVPVLALFLSCSSSALDRSKAASILESRPWGQPQGVVFTEEQLACGVTAGLWTYDPPVDGGRFQVVGSWKTTSEGNKLWLGEVIDRRPGQLVGGLKPGFPISATVTGVAADAGGENRRRVEATVAAKIGHPCFPTPLSFIGAARMDFAFALFDDGWRVVQ